MEYALGLNQRHANTQRRRAAYRPSPEAVLRKSTKSELASLSESSSRASDRGDRSISTPARFDSIRSQPRTKKPRRRGQTKTPQVVVGGEAGIRTLGRTLKALQRFSKPPPSASRPPHLSTRRRARASLEASPSTRLLAQGEPCKYTASNELCERHCPRSVPRPRGRSHQDATYGC